MRFPAVRWVLAVGFALATLLALGLVLMTAGLSLFPAAALAGVTVWLVEGADPDRVRPAATWLTRVGLAGVAAELVALAAFSIL